MTQANQDKNRIPEIVDQESILYIDPINSTAICTVHASEKMKGYSDRVKEVMLRADPSRKHLAITVYVDDVDALNSPPMGATDEDIEKTLLTLFKMVKAQPKLVHLTEDGLFNELVTDRFFQGIFGEKSEEQMKDLFQQVVSPCFKLVCRIVDEDLYTDIQDARWAEIRFEAVLSRVSFLPALSVFLSAPSTDCFMEALGLRKI